MHRHTVILAALLMFGAGCMSASHRVSRMGDRRSPRAEACTPATLETFADHGPPDRPIERFAVVSSECRESKEEECRQHLLRGGCEVNADALIDVTNRLVRGHRQMVGTAVEYVSTDAPAPSSGGSASH